MQVRGEADSGGNQGDAAAAAAAAAKSLQSCPTLCDPIDGSPTGSPIPGILQARTLEWVAISFSNAWKWKVKVKLLSRVRLFRIPWTAVYQAPPSMGFSRQEYWSGVPVVIIGSHGWNSTIPGQGSTNSPEVMLRCMGAGFLEALVGSQVSMGWTWTQEAPNYNSRRWKQIYACIL